MRRADPSDSLYQRWLTYKEITALTINKESSDADLANKKRKKDSDTSFTYYRAEEYSLPVELHPHLSAVFNTVQAPSVIVNNYQLKEGEKGFKPTQFKTNLLTVDFLNSLYEIPSNLGNKTLSQSVLQLSDSYFSPGDLLLFQQVYGQVEQAAVDIGGHNTTECDDFYCVEGNMDIQYISGIAQETTSIFWYVDSSSGDDPFLLWATQMQDEEDPPRSNSISWAAVEYYEGVSLLDAWNAEALKLALMGVTITVASGDSGVTGYYCNSCDYPTTPTYEIWNCPCQADSGSDVSSWPYDSTWTGTGYFPYFPAASPYVTTVGATMGPETLTPEVACEAQLGGVITTGGGFSTYYPQPSWQTQAVANYFGNLTSQPVKGFNVKGRAYPDVSLIGVDYQ
eukprot:gene29131-36124_t